MIALVADDPRALFAKLSGDMVSVGGSQIEDATIDEASLMMGS